MDYGVSLYVGEFVNSLTNLAYGTFSWGENPHLLLPLTSFISLVGVPHTLTRRKPVHAAFEHRPLLRGCDFFRLSSHTEV